MSFLPPVGLRNAHLNTILGSAGPRKWLVQHRAGPLLAAAREVLLDCRDGVRLHGEFSPNADPRRGLVILIHGWEGSARSTYLLSTAAHLFARGFSVFRLHLRDHGPTHHLNREPFLAIRLDEVLDALEQVQARFVHDDSYLVGYSLGGNIAVRAAAALSGRAIQLRRVVAVCPPVDPARTAEALRRSPLYNRYFVRKWQRSFQQKIRCFPEHAANRDVFEHRDLVALHQAFVPRYSNHPDAASYFRAYTLNSAVLPTLQAPCHIILAEDDPVVPVATRTLLPAHANLTLEVTRYGGHCGFVKDYALRAWVDERIDRLLHP